MVKNMSSYFIKFNFENDNTNKIVELDSKELLSLLSADIENYILDNFTDAQTPISDYWVVEKDGYSVDLKQYFKNYEVSEEFIFKIFPNLDNDETVTCELLEENSYEYFLSHLKSKNISFSINFDQYPPVRDPWRTDRYDAYDAYSDE